EKDGKTYWFFPSDKEMKPTSKAFLIPGFDEYFIAYKDRSEILDPHYAKELNQGGGMINGAIIVNGKMVGGWKRILGKKTVVITIKLFEKISEEQEQSIHEQAQQYGDFHNLPVTIKKSLH
ncbi:MAG TPA: crosslink repair DNA glycosylase YcaQ family protein, partial [Candidatus Saccharimonadales bacterium]|nr:crosslink repair DNA glycosylase YcaQ family protein [Candidatus Saccharimonadales bacterium]